MKILILAGGRGTRLWPLSRKQKPKQFQKLISEKTMLQETAARLLPLFPLEDIFISTNKEYAKEIGRELPEIPKKNIILEPANRERVAAIALFMATIKKRNFKEPLLVLPSDHLIKKKEEFQRAILAGEEFVKKNPKYIVLLGEKPTFPDTGLGYVKKGKKIAKIGENKIYQIPFFKEKPNLKRTRSFLKTRKYLWNTAIYIFTPLLMEREIKNFIPDNYQRYKNIRKTRGQGNFNKILEKEYFKMDSVSLEYTILENYPKTALIPVEMGWSDIGSWTVLKNCLSLPGENFIKGNFVGFETKNVMVYGPSNKLVAGIGIRDLIISVTDDIILICHQNKSQKIKKMIKKLEKEKKFDYI